VAKHRGIWPVTWMCEVLDVSPSGFYAWMVRPASVRARYDAQLLTKIRLSFEESDRTYGVRRVWPDLKAWGYGCGRERVARLMRQAALVARPRRRRRPTDAGPRPESSIAPNVLDREFSATSPNARWVADFTYVWTYEGWLYVAVVLDLYSRLIVGWSMKARMTSDLVTDALMMAIWRRRPASELLFHSDQGSQYASEDFQRVLSAHGIECSMSRRGDVWDNAAMESFFSSLKVERTDRRVYRTRDDARADVFDYMERFYNPRRRHSSLGYLSPMEFEKGAEQT
jgi:putative transposase